ncbi:hypothetical protein [Xenorhabdus littoralis]|uniref:hypothetical protein n=1 Tax=Xenorhabdus littoralis TaxID=2582835 RepID=UPI0029E7D1E6|nr:hypothetical protein [Xenorhabdus sp. psl]MDX7992935.1 hypothetical protein [Xenorhabdus sp. psl]
MPTIKSKLMPSAQPSEETKAELLKQINAPAGTNIQLMVLEVDYDRKKLYVCLSGGNIVDGEPHFTVTGKAAFEALCNVQTINEKLTIQQIVIGETPLKNKVKSTLKNAPANSSICFIGDMQGELDGVLIDIFNISK